MTERSRRRPSRDAAARRGSSPSGRAPRSQAPAPAQRRQAAPPARRPARPSRPQPSYSRTPARQGARRADERASAPPRGQLPAQALPVRIASRMWERSRALCVILIAALIILAAFGIDSIANAGRIYPGVRIGEVDASGMTVDEAVSAVQARYQDALTSTTVFIFDSQETADSADIDELMRQQDALAEQISYEEAQSTRSMWMASAQTLDAVVPVHQLVTEALDVGRDGRILDRISAAAGGWDIAPRIDFGDGKLESLEEDIDATLGELRVDWGIRVTEGRAEVTEGHDGEMMDPAWFRSELTDDLLRDYSGRVKMVARIEHAPIRIDQAQAEAVRAAVDAAIADGASFEYDGKSMDADRVMLGDWVTTDTVERNGGWALEPHLDPAGASQSIASTLTEGETGDGIAVRFEVSGDDVAVIPDAPVVVPSVGTAVAELDESLFGRFRETGEYAPGELRFGIPIQTETSQGPFSFEDARANGLITRFATYTTSYNDNASTQNRKFNIHRAADSLNNTVIAAGGGTWSFNDNAGACDEAAGYKDANAIMDGEVVAEPGGGVCQVATTVFNAVYESGFPVLERHNHTLRMRSYPDGRDAAIAYPTMDLRWSNDSGSDVLMRTGYSETTVTVSLYGVSPGYTVKTEVGDWKEGKKHATKVRVDAERPQGYVEVKTVGTDGMEIYVVRTVTDEAGAVVREDRFDSVYSPVDEIIVTGPDTPVDTEDDAAEGAEGKAARKAASNG